MIEEVLPFMYAFFDKIEQRLSISLKRPIEFEKRIQSDDYASLWNKRLEESPISSYIGEITEGFGPVLQAGILDCKAFQEEYTKNLHEQKLLINAVFDHSKVEILENTVTYDGVPYERIVFCEGSYATENPYFKWLPFNLCQGDWAIIRTKKDLTSKVLNNKTNVIPLGDNTYKLSSTFSWKKLDWKPSPAALAELKASFEELFEEPYEVIDQQAGVRPTVADRRPYLGSHPTHKQLFIFNGLGTKGVMLAPYFSNHLVQHILEGKDLLPEVDIKRHMKRFLNLG